MGYPLENQSSDGNVFHHDLRLPDTYNSFKLFDQNLALTGGDPNHATEMLALNIYQTFYARAGMQWKGYGQAKAVIFCVLVIIISLVQLKATRSKEVQQ